MLGRACGILLFPQVLSLATVVIAVVVFFSGYKDAYGLHKIHYMTLDFSGLHLGNFNLTQYATQANLSQIYTVGTNGYCYGTKGTDSNHNITACETPNEPFWFNLEQVLDQTAFSSVIEEIKVPTELLQYNNIAHKVSLGMWWCWVATLVLGALTFLIGFGAIFSRGAACCVSLLCGLTGVASIIAAGMATALYRVYSSKFNDVVDNFGVTATLDASGLVAAWAVVVCNVAAGLLWTLITCCCGSPRREPRYVKADTEPYMGYVPHY